MDHCMLFNVHIDKPYKKVTGILMSMNPIKDSYDKDTRIQVVQALALRFGDYCLVI